MARYIDADEFEVFGAKVPDGVDADGFMAGVNCVLDQIDEAPTADVVEVVRCMDCKYYIPESEDWSGWCRVWENVTYDDQFCSQAERRTDG